jgi:hypothetical protein
MTVINATPTTFWDQVVKVAQPGDTVLCADGTYENFHLYNLSKAAPGITIKPADGASVVINGISLDGSGGYTFDGITCAGVVFFGNGDSMVFKNGKIINQPTPGYSMGVMVRNSTNCTIDTVEITGLGMGVAFYDNSKGGHKLLNCYIHDILGPDAIDIFSSSNIEIGYNTIHDIFPGVGDHPDACQVDSPVAGGTRTANINIHDNYYYRGVNSFNQVNSDGTTSVNVSQGAQGIAFCGNADNVTIKGNANFGAMWNNISLAACNNCVIDDNYCNSYSQGTLTYSGNIVVRGGSTNCTFTNNIANSAGPYVPAGDPPLVNCTFTNTIIIPAAKDINDRSTLDTWLASHPNCGSTLANRTAPIVTPPVVVPPVVVPPVVDPKDAIIADLQNQLSVSSKAITDLTASLTVSQGQVTKLTATNKTLYARIGTLQYWLKRLKSEIDTALAV